jgi:tRNA (mo5U34)-methyltransferase
MMRNVWFMPAPDALVKWLARNGFRNVRVLDVSTTTVREQRSTQWMRFKSLADFLDPDDPARTIEGLPAPRRGIFLAEAG